MRATVRRVAGTDSCWPVTWNRRAPNRSIRGNWDMSVGDDGQRTMMIASIRYLDGFVRQGGQWLFAERRLMVNWTETRPSAA